MSEATYHIGDVFDVMATLPDNSVDLVLTSPPFLALRSYLPDDHPDKAKEIGSEPTPAEFIDTLLALTAEWDRVLAPHGSICIELGDTYAGTNTTGSRRIGDTFDGNSRREEASTHKYAGEWANPGFGDGFKGGNPGGQGWPLDKSLTGIPTLYAWSLAYGRNLLTGEPSPAGQWRIRNVVAWVRPNPPVGALGDKFRPGTSYLTIACKARDRWFDLDDVRRPLTDRALAEVAVGGVTGGESYQGEAADGSGYSGERVRRPAEGGGAPPLDWWQVSTEPYSGSHYATWPRKLLERPIRSMCPSEVCRTCGEPRRRIVEKSPEYQAIRDAVGDFNTYKGDNDRGTGNNGGSRAGQMGTMTAAEYVTTGFTDCGHDDYRRGVVLDPFAGSGTTLAVATGLGRDAIGIDIDERNADLARERVGMFLTVAPLNGDPA